MERRTFLATLPGLFAAPSLLADKQSSRFQYCMLKVGQQWSQRTRALIKLSFEVQKRCNIPIESRYATTALKDVARVNSPFLLLAGRGAVPAPTPEEAGLLRIVLGGGGVMLIDDHSPKGDDAFYKSAVAFMKKVYPEQPVPAIIPPDHAVYQSYYLLKKPRGRLNKKDYLEGWNMGKRTNVFYSHNDLLGAMEADQLGNWTHNMELGGGLRRELCFRLGINLTYYALTINYKKDRAFPPIIERRRRL
ncbi:MAG: DUF4159 domain-containing protein [Acidobacteriota bacterium]|nr:DUF4159 domain-containing protein [Acidobacteriota bacterium]